MSVKNNIQAIPFVSIASTALTSSFQAINPLGLPFACFLLRVTNFGDTLISISFDGVNPALQIAAGGTLEVYGGDGSSSPNTNFCLWAKGQVIYTLGTAGTAGVIGISGFYQPQGV